MRPSNNLKKDEHVTSKQRSNSTMSGLPFSPSFQPITSTHSPKLQSKKAQFHQNVNDLQVVSASQISLQKYVHGSPNMMSGGYLNRGNFQRSVNVSPKNFNSQITNLNKSNHQLEPLYQPSVNANLPPGFSRRELKITSSIVKSNGGGGAGYRQSSQQRMVNNNQTSSSNVLPPQYS